MTSKLFRKKRGKFDEIREERKKRRGEIARDNAKRRKLENGAVRHLSEDVEASGDVIEDDEGDYVAFEDTTPEQPAQDEAVFYGLLDTEEQTYYANINSKIVSNDFESDEDRHNFIEAVYRESSGKELKLASSQSCSRYLEKIMMLSTPDQLHTFFGKLLGNLTHLVQHRFGSHVCETLFLEGAKYATQGKKDDKQAGDDEAVKMEMLFLQAAEELKPNVGYMLTDRFASHTIRVLLLVLSGDPLDDASTKALLASKKKEKLDAPVKAEITSMTFRNVPKSFKKAMSGLITAAVSSLDTTYLRALATHPTGNPVLQLLLRLELSNSDKGRQLKEDSFYYKIVSPDSLDEDSEGIKFVSGLTYDSTGSHLVEILVIHSPGKIFKKLYKNVWKDRMASMAKNDIASYVAIRILERLGKDDLAEARETLLLELPTLLERRRMVLVKCLVDRSVVRDLDLKPVAKAIKQACNDDTGLVVPRLLVLESAPTPSKEPQKDSTEPPTIKADTHGSLLAQSMLQAPAVSTLVQDSLLTATPDLLIHMSQDPAASRVLQSALTSSTATVGFRKQMIPKFYDHIAELAKSPVGSYLVDALWDATTGLHFMKEQLAGKLAAHESDLRDSLSGRNVWRNWSMDTYQRRPAEWRALAKGQGPKSAEEDKPKSAFQLAQERHGEMQSRKERRVMKPARAMPAGV